MSKIHSFASESTENDWFPSLQTITETLKTLSEKVVLETMMVGSGFDVKSDEAGNAGYIMYTAGLIYMIADVAQKFLERSELVKAGKEIDLSELKDYKKIAIDSALLIAGVAASSTIASSTTFENSEDEQAVNTQVALAAVAGLASFGYIRLTKVLETANAKARDEILTGKVDGLEKRNSILEVELERVSKKLKGLELDFKEKDETISNLEKDNKALLSRVSELEENTVRPFDGDQSVNIQCRNSELTHAQRVIARQQQTQDGGNFNGK